MNLDFNRLRTFVTVADIGSVTKAAIELHLTQQAVSSQIQLLEQELGLLLFKRANRRIYLSKQGKTLLSIAKPHLEAMKQDVLLLTGEISSMQSKLVIGCTNEIAEAFLAVQISEFQKENPNISFEIALDSDERTEKAILNGDVDLGFMVFSKEVKLLNVLPFLQEEFITVATPTYLNSKQKITSFTDILSHHLVDFEPQCPSLKMWILKNDKKLAAEFEHKTAKIAVNDDNLIKKMVLQDMGVANLPKSLIQTELSSGQVQEILPNSKKVSAGIDIISIKHKTVSAAEKAFIHFLFSAQ